MGGLRGSFCGIRGKRGSFIEPGIVVGEGINARGGCLSLREAEPWKRLISSTIKLC